MMKNGIKKSTAQEQKWTRRHMGVAAMAGVATVFLSGCIGGGGGGGSSDDDDVDLRAMYDKINGGMTHDEVTRIIGYQPQSVSNATRIWDSGNQHLGVGFSIFDGVWIVVAVQWWTSSGQELTKTF